MKQLYELTKKEVGQILMIGSLCDAVKLEKNELRQQTENLACILLQNMREDSTIINETCEQLIKRLTDASYLIDHLKTLLEETAEAE